MAWFVLILSLVFSYLIGSINAAIIISRTVAHKDVRNYGSGNAGMTNVMRVMGLKPGLCTFAVDCLKGALVCLLARFVVFPYVFSHLGYEALRPEYAVYYCGILCLLGHVYPVFFGFRGGKGVATLLGVLLVCQYETALIAFAIFILIFALTRIVSLGSICSALSLPFLNMAFAKDMGGHSVLAQCLLMGVAAFIVIFLHRSNIVRLLHGEEKKLTLHRKKESDDNGEA